MNSISAEIKLLGAAHEESVSAPFWVETWKTMDFNRMFISPLLLLATVILGALAAAFGAWSSTVELTMVVAPTMAVLALTLAVVPMRWIIGAFGLSLLMDILVVII